MGIIISTRNVTEIQKENSHTEQNFNAKSNTIYKEKYGFSSQNDINTHHGNTHVNTKTTFIANPEVLIINSWIHLNGQRIHKNFKSCDDLFARYALCNIFPVGGVCTDIFSESIKSCILRELDNDIEKMENKQKNPENHTTSTNQNLSESEIYQKCVSSSVQFSNNVQKYGDGEFIKETCASMSTGFQNIFYDATKQKIVYDATKQKISKE